MGVQPFRSLQVRGRCRFLKHCKKGNRRLAGPCEGFAKSQVRDRPVQAKVHGTGSPCKSVQVRVSIRYVFTGVCALAVLHERHLRWYLQESVFFFASRPRILLGIYRSPCSCCARNNAICVGIYKSPCVLFLVSHAL